MEEEEKTMTYIGCFFEIDMHRQKYYIRNTTKTIVFDTLGMWFVNMIGTVLQLTQTTITYKSDIRDPSSCTDPDLLLQLQQYQYTHPNKMKNPHYHCLFSETHNYHPRYYHQSSQIMYLYHSCILTGDTPLPFDSI